MPEADHDPDAGCTPPAAQRREAKYLQIAITVALVGILGAVYVPRWLDHREAHRQNYTMYLMRTIGKCLDNYVKDHGSLPDVPPGADASRVLAPFFVPTYLRSNLPERDSWGRPFTWTHGVVLGEKGRPVASYTLVSLGKDGLPDASLPPLGYTTSFNSDIYFSDGQFTIYPNLFALDD